MCLTQLTTILFQLYRCSLFIGETKLYSGENHRPVASHKTNKAVSSTLDHKRKSNCSFNVCDSHSCTLIKFNYYGYRTLVTTRPIPILHDGEQRIQPKFADCGSVSWQLILIRLSTNVAYKTSYLQIYTKSVDQKLSKLRVSRYLSRLKCQVICTKLTCD